MGPRIFHFSLLHSTAGCLFADRNGNNEVYFSEFQRCSAGCRASFSCASMREQSAYDRIHIHHYWRLHCGRKRKAAIPAAQAACTGEKNGGSGESDTAYTPESGGVFQIRTTKAVAAAAEEIRSAACAGIDTAAPHCAEIFPFPGAAAPDAGAHHLSWRAR